jgi:RNA recognition motif-containing protein
MAVSLYVGNLPWSVTETELAEAFSGVGQVQGARIIADPNSGRSRGFGFVELEGVGLQEAVEAMSGFELQGRRLTVGPARPRPGRD